MKIKFSYLDILESDVQQNWLFDKLSMASITLFHSILSPYPVSTLLLEYPQIQIQLEALLYHFSQAQIQTRSFPVNKMTVHFTCKMAVLSLHSSLVRTVIYNKEFTSRGINLASNHTGCD